MMKHTQCGRAWEESTCPVCGSGIGGELHALRSDNKVARQLVHVHQLTSPHSFVLS